MWTEQSVFCCVFFGTKGARSGSQFYCRSGSDKMIWILWNNYLLYNPTVLSTENAIGQVKPKVLKKVWIFQNNYCTSVHLVQYNFQVIQILGVSTVNNLAPNPHHIWNSQFSKRKLLYGSFYRFSSVISIWALNSSLRKYDNCIRIF